MCRGVLVILILSLPVIAQDDKDISTVSRGFLESVWKGDFAAVGDQVSGSSLGVDGKTYGAEDEKPVTEALKILHDSGFRYHKELYKETSNDVSRVYVEMISLPDVDLFEILLIKTKGGWKVSGWRRVSPPIRRPLPAHPSFPNGIPCVRPCTRCT
jgi:hypothetical protein